jgi:hypothetical protein
MALTIPALGTALLFIDVVNDLAFPGSGALIEQAEPMATRLGACPGTGLATRYRGATGLWRRDTNAGSAIP